MTRPSIAVDIELAWAAGLFDGEGTIFASKRFKPGTDVCYAPLMMAVAMTEQEPVARFQRALGIGRVGKINRPTVTGKTVWRWTISSEHDVRYAHSLLEPYLCFPKVTQAYQAFAIREAAVAKLTYGRKTT